MNMEKRICRPSWQAVLALELVKVSGEVADETHRCPRSTSQFSTVWAFRKNKFAEADTPLSLM